MYTSINGLYIPTQDVIAAVPPHWRDGVTHEGKGPTYAGAVRTYTS